jgi:hypothetical protein
MDRDGKVRDRVRFSLKDMDTPVFCGNKEILVGTEFFLMGIEMKVALDKYANLDKFRTTVNPDTVGVGLLNTDPFLKYNGSVTG